jgi:polyisoprenoid-binding protein YceI
MKPSSRAVFAALTVLALAPFASAAVESYKIDPVHSSVGFTIRHFFSQVPGAFTKFHGTIVVDREHLDQSSVEATIDVASIDTREPKRDEDLRSKNFFAVAEYPTIVFKSKRWQKTGDDTFDVTGDLTMKGVTKEVVLNVKSLGFGPGMRGAMLSGWKATTTLKREDFGITSLPKVLGDEVPITINVEADLQK